MRPPATLRGARPLSAVATMLFFVALASLPAYPAGNVRVSGRVTGEDGAPVPGLTVVLTPIDASGQPSGEGPTTEVVTNKKGKFVFGFAKPGDYALSVEHGDLQAVAATVKLRDGERKPVRGPQGPIEDRSGALDPADPRVALGIPSGAFYVEVDLTVGTPPKTARGTGATAVATQIVTQGLGDEVEDILALIEKEDFSGALDEVDALLVEDPELAPLHYVRGFTLIRLGRLDEATQALREALRIDPEIQGVSGMLGQVLGERGEYEQACEALERELELTTDPGQRAGLLLSLGQARLALEDAEASAVALEEALALAPEDDRIRAHLANAYIVLGRDEDAEGLLGSGVDAAAGAVLHYNLAANLLRAEKWQEAIVHLEQTLELDPTVSVAHRHLGDAYLSLGDMQKAIEHFDAYLANSPDPSDEAEVRDVVEALRQIVAEQQ